MDRAAQSGMAAEVGQAAEAAGLRVVGTETGKDFTGRATTRFTLGPAGAGEGTGAGKTQVLELSDGLELGAGGEAAGGMKAELRGYLAEAAVRLRNPRPECFLTLTGLPLSFGKFAWPFHASTSGADTFVLHGEVRLEDGQESVLHAKVAAALTVTFREILASMEQPFAEAVIYNAIRKTMDQGQLELVKSGNRQPVPVTTRYYNARRKEFVFNDTTAAERQEFLTAKVFWLSGVLGGGAPVWLHDPRDASYLNTTVAVLRESAQGLAAEGLITLSTETGFAAPTEALMGHREEYFAVVAAALASIKPTFNEEMRGGHTNM